MFLFIWNFIVRSSCLSYEVECNILTYFQYVFSVLFSCSIKDVSWLWRVWNYWTMQIRESDFLLYVWRFISDHQIRNMPVAYIFTHKIRLYLIFSVFRISFLFFLVDIAMLQLKLFMTRMFLIICIYSQRSEIFLGEFPF